MIFIWVQLLKKAITVFRDLLLEVWVEINVEKRRKLANLEKLMSTLHKSISTTPILKCWKAVSMRKHKTLYFTSRLNRGRPISCSFYALFNNVRSVQSLSHVRVLQPHALQHARLPCPSPAPRVYSNSCPFSQWCHPTFSCFVVLFFSCLQSSPASGSFQMSQLFTSGGQSIGVSASASVLPVNTQDWSPLGWTGWISLQSKGLSRVFSNTAVQKHQFFSTQLSL